MSGGAYGYAYEHFERFAETIRDDGSCNAAPPAVRRAFRAHLRAVAAAAKAIEWNDSGDGASREQELIRAVVGPAAELAETVRAAKEAREALDKAIWRARETT